MLSYRGLAWSLKEPMREKEWKEKLEAAERGEDLDYGEKPITLTGVDLSNLLEALKSYEEYKKEKAKWEIPIANETLSEWVKLADSKQWKELHEAQAKVIENWLHERPQLVEELANPSPVRAEFMKSLGIPYSFGLFFLATNVLLKLYGLKDDVCEIILNRILPKIKEEKREYANLAYMKTANQLAKQGAAVIRNFELYLLRIIDNTLKKEIPDKRVDTFTDLEEKMKARSGGKIEEIEYDTVLWQKSDYYQQETLDWATQIDRLIDARKILSSLPKDKKTALNLLAMGWTQKDVAKYLGVTERTIRNWIKEIQRQYSKQKWNTSNVILP